MSCNVLRFPSKGAPGDAWAPGIARQAEQRPKRKYSVKNVLHGFFTVIWFLLIPVWFFGRWILALECFFQFLRMLYYWKTPGMHAGWTFVLHFGLLSALCAFVFTFEPKGIEAAKEE